MALLLLHSAEAATTFRILRMLVKRVKVASRVDHIADRWMALAIGALDVWLKDCLVKKEKAKTTLVAAQQFQAALRLVMVEKMVEVQRLLSSRANQAALRLARVAMVFSRLLRLRGCKVQAEAFPSLFSWPWITFLPSSSRTPPLLWRSLSSKCRVS